MDTSSVSENSSDMSQMKQYVKDLAKVCKSEKEMGAGQKKTEGEIWTQGY